MPAVRSSPAAHRECLAHLVETDPAATLALLVELLSRVWSPDPVDREVSYHP